MKKLLFFIMISAVYTFAQDDKQKNPGVELPDFVITGKENISIQKTKKIPPDFVPVISEEFIKPVFSPEKLETKDLAQPIKEDINLFDSLDFFKGGITAAAGLYALPKAKLGFTHPFGQNLLNLHLNAYNYRAYVDNSDKYGLGAGAAYSYFVDNDSKFLPGAVIKLNGGYDLNSYKLFASNFPVLRRSLSTADGGMEIQYLSDKIITGAIKVNNEYSSLNSINYTENLLSFNGFGKVQLSNFALGVHSQIKSVTLKNSLFQSASYGYTGVRPFIGLSVSDAFKASFGMNFEFYDSKTVFNPYASVGIKLEKNISLFAEYAPGTELLGSSGFLKTNYYLRADSTSAYLYKKRSYIRTAVKYEYGKYFEIDGGFDYTSSNNYPYFTPSSKGEFRLAAADAKRFEVFVNLLFHTGPYGTLYGNFAASDTRDTSNSIIPYSPAFRADLFYSYLFSKKFSAGIKLNYISGSYVDLANSRKTEGLIDLGLKSDYRVNEKFAWTLEVNNILNRNNYIWNGYKEMPVDAAVGIRYNW